MPLQIFTGNKMRLTRNNDSIIARQNATKSWQTNEEEIIQLSMMFSRKLFRNLSKRKALIFTPKAFWSNVFAYSLVFRRRFLFSRPKNERYRKNMK